MLHSTDRAKSKESDYTVDWTGINDQIYSEPQFYPIPDLKKDGFIHTDGSLKFEFQIKKQNYRKRAEEAQKRAEEAEKGRIEAERRASMFERKLNEKIQENSNGSTQASPSNPDG